MTITVMLDDREFVFPDDATEQEILKFVSREIPLPGQTSTARGVAQGVGQGAFLGFSDEIAGNLVAGAAKVTGDERPFTEIRDEVIEAERASFDEFAQREPGLAIASSILGGAVTAKPAIGVLNTARVPTQGVKGLAASGAVIGGAAGAGAEGEGTRLEGAAKGGALGVAFAGTISGLGFGLTQLRGAVTRRVAPGFKNRLKAIADESGLTPAQIQTRLSVLGPKAVIADVADVFQRAADVAAGRLGPTSKKLKALIRRDETQFGRLMDPIRKTLGGTEKSVQTVNEPKDIRIQQASPLYEAAFDAGITNTTRMQDLLTRPETKKAWRSVGNLGRSDPDIDISTLVEGFAPSFRGWQAVTERLSDRVSTLRRSGKLKAANIIARLRQAVLSELDAQSPEYKQARALWAGTKQADDMLELGGRFMKTTASEIGELMKTMSEGDKAFYRLGIGRAIEERLATANDTTDLARIFRNESFRLKAKAAFPDTESMVDFLNTVQAESIKKNTTNLVGRGSQTQPRKVVEAQLGGASIGVEDASTRGVINRILSNVGGIRETTIQKIGDALLTASPAEQRRVIQMLQQIDPQASLQIGVAGATGANVAGGL